MRDSRDHHKNHSNSLRDLKLAQFEHRKVVETASSDDQATLDESYDVESIVLQSSHDQELPSKASTRTTQQSPSTRNKRASVDCEGGTRTKRPFQEGMTRRGQDIPLEQPRGRPSSIQSVEETDEDLLQQKLTLARVIAGFDNSSQYGDTSSQHDCNNESQSLHSSFRTHSSKNSKRAAREKREHGQERPKQPSDRDLARQKRMIAQVVSGFDNASFYDQSLGSLHESFYSDIPSESDYNNSITRPLGSWGQYPNTAAPQRRDRQRQNRASAAPEPAVLTPGAYQMEGAMNMGRRQKVASLTTPEENTERPIYSSSSSYDGDMVEDHNFEEDDFQIHYQSDDDSVDRAILPINSRGNRFLAPEEQKQSLSCYRRRVCYFGMAVVLVAVVVSVMFAILVKVGPTKNAENEEVSDTAETIQNWAQLVDLCNDRQYQDSKVLNLTSRLPQSVQEWLNVDIGENDMGLGLAKSNIGLDFESCSPQSLAAISIALALSDGDGGVMDFQTKEEEEERYALSVFFFAMSGDIWKMNLNWLSNNTVCSWYGVQCHTNSSTVSKLTLQGNGLQGSLPAELLLLSNFQYLQIRDNDITGDAFYVLLQMTGLQFLDLYATKVEGTLPPEIATSLNQLTNFGIGSEKLYGSLPTEFGTMHQLDRLYFGAKELSGTIPTEYAQLTNLGAFEVFGEIGGSFPDQIWALPRLTHLRIFAQQILDGIFPEDLFERATKFKEIVMPFSGIRGSLPASIGNLSNLEKLVFQGSSITGSIPSDIGRCTNLRELNLGQTAVDGTLPSELGGLSRIEILDLHENQLTGTIPNEFQNLKSLVRLRLELQGSALGEGFHGTIPAEICQFSNLTEVVLSCTTDLFQSCPGCCSCIGY